MTPWRFRTVVTDIDDTLCPSGQALTSRTSQLLSRLAKVGVTVILVTGRAEASALAIARSIHTTAPVIHSGGAGITDPLSSECLHVASWSQAEVSELVAIGKRFGFQPTFWTLERVYAEELTGMTKLLEDYLDAAVIVCSFPELIACEPIIKITFCAPPTHIDAVVSEFSAAMPDARRATAEFFDVTPSGSSKADSVLRVLNRLGLAPDECIGFGDGDNDKDWMRLMGRPVAVSNASDGVLAIAKEVIGAGADEGVATYLETQFFAGN